MNASRTIARIVLLWGFAFGIVTSGAGGPGESSTTGSIMGWSTNGPAVCTLVSAGTQVLPPPYVSYSPPPTNFPMDVRRAMIGFRVAAATTTIFLTNRVFHHYLPESLNYLVWTNFIAHTNGRNTIIWSVRSRPPDWPARPPIVQWNQSSLMWGMRGMTALSPCWEQEGNPGQVPITALTRRHGYTRGHSMGADRVDTIYAGKKVWFLTAQNKIVQTTVLREVVRTHDASGRDYTIVLFSSDLPASIQPMRVVAPNLVWGIPESKYAFCGSDNSPIFATEQGDNVSAGVPGFSVDIGKGGDSGSPNMLPLPGELVFYSGRSTSGASPEMQADMNELCRLEGLDARKYQLQWVDLSGYPTYGWVHF